LVTSCAKQTTREPRKGRKKNPKKIKIEKRNKKKAVESSVIDFVHQAGKREKEDYIIGPCLQGLGLAAVEYIL
jgi:hypothetical protein